MAHGDYIDHLEAKLRDVDRGIVRAETRLRGADIADTARAIADLAHLRTRHKELTAAIDEARAKGAGDWGALRTSFQEEAEALSDTVEAFLTRLG